MGITTVIFELAEKYLHQNWYKVQFQSQNGSKTSKLSKLNASSKSEMTNGDEV